MITLSGLLFLSCNEGNSNENLVASVKKIELDIKGMTCEIGCAKTIESKLLKTEGVQVVSVSFDDEKGIVEYDANKTDEDKIIAVIQEIADGELYSVAGTKLIRGSN